MAEQKKLGIYLHIPFCLRKCAYCDFLSYAGNEKTIALYVKCLCREIASYRYLSEEYSVSTVFIGGGTPSVLSAEQIEIIMSTLKETFSATEVSFCDEISMECNPGTVTAKKLETYFRCGIRRISFGLQSSNNRELSLLGRIHTWEDFVDSYHMCREAGFSNINVDVMAALPSQTLSSFEQSIANVVSLKPEHISCYSLMIEENTPFHKRYANHPELLPSEEEERQMDVRAESLLEVAGYHRYEISNYAKSGYECKHNIGYWTRNEYLGLGLGASSLIREVRYQNESNMERYLKRLQSGEYHLIRVSEQQLTVREQMEEYMFLGLRMTEGIEKRKFQLAFGQAYDKVYGEVSKRLVAQGTLIDDSKTVRLTTYGRDISNVVLADFLF